MPDWKGSIGLFFISDQFLSVNFATSPYIRALSGDFASHATFYKLSQNGILTWNINQIFGLAYCGSAKHHP